VREALFSIWGERVAGARFLDLFAGSGVVGLEAAGRGARSVLAVDADPRAVRTVEKNAGCLEGSIGGGRFAVRRLTLPAGLARLLAEGAGPFDLAFADPPYAFAEYGPLLVAAAALLAAEDPEIVVEHASRTELPAAAGPLARVDVRRYGEGSLSFYRRMR
jgi:16S rRNA (guanine(966)-N(2))-methyltransferase RsmD